MKNIKNNSFKIALGGVISALSVTLMLLTGVIPTLTYAIPAICGVLLTMIVIEAGSAFALAVYVSVSLISMLLVADKEAALMYLMFFGYYPILKGFIEKKLKKPFDWIVKLLVFNVSVVLATVIATKVFLIPFEEIDFLGKFAIPLLLILGNIVFVLYDIAMTRLISLYIYKLRKFIKKLFK